MELRLTITPFDAAYAPADLTRLTTNFANLAKDPQGRSGRINSTLASINKRFRLALGEPEEAQHYQLAIDILSISIRLEGSPGEWFPMTETLSCRIHDRRLDRWLPGPTGCSYSSYVRDHDFNSLLPKIRAGEATMEEAASFGDLHGLLYRLQFRQVHPAGVLDEPLLIAISVASGRTYRRCGTTHPVLGHQYLPEHGESTTSHYFAKMGLVVSYFMPPGSRAPLAFYHEPDDLLGRSRTDLAAIIGVMDTFESIYRPQIYCTWTPAGVTFQPDLANLNHDPPVAFYDRLERDTKLGLQQADLVSNAFLLPNAVALRRLIAEHGYLLNGQ